jgi:hypothetical protein
MDSMNPVKILLNYIHSIIENRSVPNENSIKNMVMVDE